jgi:hypothetical protein
MHERISTFIHDEDGGWSTGEWAVITAGAVALGVGLYQNLEITYQDDTVVYFDDRPRRHQRGDKGDKFISPHVHAGTRVFWIWLNLWR